MFRLTMGGQRCRGESVLEVKMYCMNKAYLSRFH